MYVFFFFKQKTAYEMRISDWSSDVCSSDLTIWRLLDYVAVDYPGAVSGGKIISPAEYAEMTEFAAQVETRLKRLPQKTAKQNLVARAATLRQSIAAKSAPATVEEQSRGLAGVLHGGTEARDAEEGGVRKGRMR